MCPPFSNRNNPPAVADPHTPSTAHAAETSAPDVGNMCSFTNLA